MVQRESTRRRRGVAAVRIAFALAALIPAAPTGADHAPGQLMPTPAARAAAVGDGEPPRELVEWERLRRHRAA